MSHHAPCDYDRTVGIFGVHVCTRCLGMACGIIPGWHLAHAVAAVGPLWCVIGTLVMTLPAAYDFAVHELWDKYRSNNLRRLVTGLMFGIVVGAYLSHMRHESTLPFFGLLAYFAAMQVAIVRLFQIYGHSDSYLERYTSAVFIETKVEPTPAHYSSPAAGAESGEA